MSCVEIKFLNHPLKHFETGILLLSVFLLNFVFLKGFENEILRSNAGGTIYSHVNSDWAVKLKYIIILLLLYHCLFNLYILL